MGVTSSLAFNTDSRCRFTESAHVESILRGSGLEPTLSVAPSIESAEQLDALALYETNGKSGDPPPGTLPPGVPAPFEFQRTGAAANENGVPLLTGIATATDVTPEVEVHFVGASAQLVTVLAQLSVGVVGGGVEGISEATTDDDLGT